MGKASSSKKVARAARAGGGRRSSGQPRSLLFPGVLGLVIVLGLALVVFTRADRRSQDLGGPPQRGDHIHMAFGVYACDAFLSDLPQFESRVGIHTHADGVIHIHPSSELGVGANATLGRYLKNVREEGSVDATLSSTKLEYLDDVFKEGDSKACEGVDDPKLRVAYWPDAASGEDPVITTGDFGDVRLTSDGGAITIFFGDPDADIPLPPTASQLAELGAVDGPTELPDPGAGNTTTTAPSATPPASDTTTTAPTGSTETTAP